VWRGCFERYPGVLVGAKPRIHPGYEKRKEKIVTYLVFFYKMLIFNSFFL